MSGMNSRERFFALLDGRPVDRAPLMPITMMFAADRIGAKYLDYATDYRVLVEAQLRTAERFDLDYVSCISDPARESADLGAKLCFFDDQPPAFVESEALVAERTVLAGLKIPDPLGGGRMLDRVKAAALFREKIGREKIIEGWIEGPCALAADLRGINTLMMDFYDDPEFVHQLLAFVTEIAIVFAKAQADAGVDLMGVGDAAASLIGPALFEEFIVPYHLKLVSEMRQMGLKTRLHICGNTAKILEMRAGLGYDINDIDQQVRMELAREKMGPEAILLGNIPTVTVMEQGTAEDVRRAAAECHSACGERYILSAGCEVPRTTPLENMDALTEYAHSLSGAASAAV
ncbi:MAG: uroporphyrinogen decarboxylase family protein [Terracidiphilus sp.]